MEPGSGKTQSWARPPPPRGLRLQPTQPCTGPRAQHRAEPGSPSPGHGSPTGTLNPFPWAPELRAQKQGQVDD